MRNSGQRLVSLQKRRESATVLAGEDLNLRPLGRETCEDRLPGCERKVGVCLITLSPGVTPPLPG
jgi:hypothetical protein